MEGFFMTSNRGRSWWSGSGRTERTCRKSRWAIFWSRDQSKSLICVIYQARLWILERDARQCPCRPSGLKDRCRGDTKEREIVHSKKMKEKERVSEIEGGEREREG
jgi:hypothetical protein